MLLLQLEQNTSHHLSSDLTVLNTKTAPRNTLLILVCVRASTDLTPQPFLLHPFLYLGRLRRALHVIPASLYYIELLLL